MFKKIIINKYKTLTIFLLCLLYTESSFATLTTSLSRGSKNTQVKELETFLLSKGYFKYRPDNVFNNNTHLALYNYQKNNKLIPTGIVGKVTREYINREIKNTAIVKNVNNATTSTSVNSPASSSGASNIAFYSSGSSGVLSVPVATSGEVAVGGGATNSTLSTVSAYAYSEEHSPKIFNNSKSSVPGDVVYFQGYNFGTSSEVWISNSSTTMGANVGTINRLKDLWVAALLPASHSGALIAHLVKGTYKSHPIYLNKATPLHLDQREIVSGGVARVFGRNLVHLGYIPTVTVQGEVSSIDQSKSNDSMIVFTVPAGLASSSSAIIKVDNGNGSGAGTLDRATNIAAYNGTDPFGLGVSWASSFATLTSNVIDVTSDSRLSSHAACDGVTNDYSAIRSALIYSANNGGGVVKLPAGTCYISGAMQIFSKTVLEGAGKASTTLLYGANTPIYYTAGSSNVGIRNMTIKNIGTATTAMTLRFMNKVFLQNIRLEIGTSSPVFFSDNRNAAVINSEFVQGGSISGSGLMHAGDNRGLVFASNTLIHFDGANVSFDRSSDVYVGGNAFVRDGRSGTLPGVTHNNTINFAYNISMIGNKYSVINPPATFYNNDGETILAEGGGAGRTENLGTVTSATELTLSDANNNINQDPRSWGYVPENHMIAIISGNGNGQSRRILSSTGNTVTIDKPWDVVPEVGSKYATAVWSQRLTIKNNELTDNPRGIMLYSNSSEDVHIVGNTLHNNGGILVRSFQNLATKQFTPIYNVKVTNNNITNNNGYNLSTVKVVFAKNEAGLSALGTSIIGVEVKGNTLNTSIPNTTSNLEGQLGVEGFINRIIIGGGTYVADLVDKIVGTIFQSNTCNNCEKGFRLGTGSSAATLYQNVVNGPGIYYDDSFTAPGYPQDKATSTIIIN